jgi:hypothetical protein
MCVRSTHWDAAHTHGAADARALGGRAAAVWLLLVPTAHHWRLSRPVLLVGCVYTSATMQRPSIG